MLIASGDVARIVGHVWFLTLHGVVVRNGCCVDVKPRYQDTSVTILPSRELDSFNGVIHRRIGILAKLSRLRRVRSEVR